jgi:hypothetical protein
MHHNRIEIMGFEEDAFSRNNKTVKSTIVKSSEDRPKSPPGDISRRISRGMKSVDTLTC